MFCFLPAFPSQINWEFYLIPVFLSKVRCEANQHYEREMTEIKSKKKNVFALKAPVSN